MTLSRASASFVDQLSALLCVFRLRSLFASLPVFRSLLLCVGLGSVGVLQAQPLSLTPAEQAWVQAHPVLRLGVAPEYPPYYFVPAEPGRPHGFIIEMIDLWAERLGMQVAITRFPTQEAALEALKQRRVDLLPFSGPGESSPNGPVAALPAITTDLVLVARRDVPDVSTANNFGDQRVALVEGSTAAAVLREHSPKARTMMFPTSEAALKAVASGGADLFVGYQQVVVYHIEKLLLANLVMRRNFGPGRTLIGPVVLSDPPELRRLLNKAIASVTSADRSAIATRWLPATVEASVDGQLAPLTQAERDWVGANGRIVVGFDSAFSPISSQGDMGEPMGLAIDYLHLLVKKTGLRLTRETGGSFASLYAQGAKGELDVIVAMARVPQRRGDYDFVGPFVRVPTAIIMRSNDAAMLTATEEFGTRRVGLLKQHFLIPELQARHPGIHLVEFDRQEQVLEALTRSKVDVALGNVKVVNELIERRFAGSIRITGTVSGGDSELYFGVRKGLPELTQVLRKGLDAVTDAERSAIAARWLVVNVQSGVDWRALLWWTMPLLVALGAGFALLWRSNRRLLDARAFEARARAVAEETTASRGRFLAYLSHELRGTLGGVAAGADMLKTHQDPFLRERLLSAMSESVRGLSQVLDATLSFEQSLSKPIDLRPQPVKLQVLWTQLMAPGRLAAEQKGLAFEAVCVEPDVLVSVDQARLQQVVVNLLQNAVKFTSTGTVRATGHWLEVDAADASPKTERTFQISVSDSGPGVSPSDVQRIFEPYSQGEQGERQRYGAGLGLAISRQIVAAMNGTLEVRSAPGEGATFVVRLPWVQIVEPAGARVVQSAW
ncbi:MAG: hypothetical protein RLZZ618_3676 [Pseudomonadota bacterium]|jgi:signal transduction histidine kinase